MFLMKRYNATITEINVITETFLPVLVIEYFDQQLETTQRTPNKLTNKHKEQTVQVNVR